MDKKVLCAEGPTPGFPGVVQAGPLLFVSGCDGHRPLFGAIDPTLAGEAERQCENAYGGLAQLLQRAGSSLESIVRLDHFTSSQDWLARRQTVRGRLFGRPAPLASTGIAGKMSGLNMITASAIAVAPGVPKEVLVQGPRYGMGNISSAVRGGPFVFLSGIRGTVDPRTHEPVPEETADAFVAQTRMCYSIIRSILTDCGLTPAAVARFDIFLRDRAQRREDETVRSQMLDHHAAATTAVALPLSARGETEITALAVGPGDSALVRSGRREHPVVVEAGGFVFVGECAGMPEARTSGWADLAGDPIGQARFAIATLRDALALCGRDLAALVRLEVYLRDIYAADAVLAELRAAFGADTPTIIVAGAELEGLLEVKINGIAVA